MVERGDRWRVFLISFVLLFLLSCSQEQGSAFGKATDWASSWAAPPTGVTLENDGTNLRVTIIGYDRVWSKGYYYDTKYRRQQLDYQNQNNLDTLSLDPRLVWKPFSFDTSTQPQYIRVSRTTPVQTTLPTNFFDTSTETTPYNSIAIWACKDGTPIEINDKTYTPQDCNSLSINPDGTKYTPLVNAGRYYTRTGDSIQEDTSTRPKGNWILKDFNTPTATCGNGIKEASELCDGGDVGSAQCGNGRIPRCTSSCTIDTASCIQTCGNGIKEGSEFCDGIDGTGTCGNGIRPQCKQDCTGINIATCLPQPTCTDGIQNQAETGIDCGGPCSSPCLTCTDHLQNQGETGIDCGGPCTACTPVLRVDTTVMVNPLATSVSPGVLYSCPTNKVLCGVSGSGGTTAIRCCTTQGFILSSETNFADSTINGADFFCAQNNAVCGLRGIGSSTVIYDIDKLRCCALDGARADITQKRAISTMGTFVFCASDEVACGAKNYPTSESRVDTLYCCKIILNSTSTCTDGIQNQAETGIDCGGPCTACVAQLCQDNCEYHRTQCEQQCRNVVYSGGDPNYAYTQTNNCLNTCSSELVSCRNQC